MLLGIICWIAAADTPKGALARKTVGAIRMAARFASETTG